MVIRELRAFYLSSIFETERWVALPVKWLLLVVGVISTGVLSGHSSPPVLAAGTLLYAALGLFFMYWFALPGSRGRQGRTLAYWVSYTSDIAFSSLVLYYSGGVSSEMYLLYALLALRSSIYYPAWHEVLILPFALCPLYVLVLRVAAGSWYFLLETSFLLRYVLLFAVVLTAVYLGWLNERSRVREASLRQRLSERTRDLDQKTGTMQQMATNLGDRVLELRTLQEGIKAINSALALEDVLRLIVANASQVLEGARCSVALFDEGRNRVVSAASSDEADGGFGSDGLGLEKKIAAWVVQQGKPFLSGEAGPDSPLAGTSEEDTPSLVSVPLFFGDRAVGALAATSPERNVFSTEHVNLLNAFADQASVAVMNARLYERLAQEQKQTAQLYEHVQQRRNELEAILRGIGDGVIVTDAALNLLLMNPVATRIFRVKPDVTQSVPLSQVLPHPELLALLQDALGQDEPIVREIPLSSEGEGRQTIFQALASPVLSADGRTRGGVAVLRDVTSQKELERMKSNFLSVVSHELKTPLHSIKGFVDIILMGKTGPLNSTQADFLGTVRDQTALLQNLISDLLESQRLESGQVKLQLTDVSMSEVANAVVAKLRAVAEQGQVKLANAVEVNFPAIEADRTRIEQVLTNLVDNAIKFTPALGTVTISASDLGAEARVAVSDTGIGISSTELEKVFDRFYQVDSGSTRHYRGAGLGLTICKHIIEYHRGRIWAESQVGKGSTFAFTLPKHLSVETTPLLLDFLSLPKQEQNQQ